MEINSYFSIHLQFIMVSHPEGLRIREENVCVNAVKLSLEIELPCSKSCSLSLKKLILLKIFVWIFGFRNV